MKYVGQLCYYDEEKEELWDLQAGVIVDKNGVEREIPLIALPQEI